MDRTAQGMFADIAATLSGGAAVTSWLATANDILQLVATGIAIVAGIYAVRWHRLRIRIAKEKINGKRKSD